MVILKIKLPYNHVNIHNVLINTFSKLLLPQKWLISKLLICNLKKKIELNNLRLFILLIVYFY